MHCHIIIQRKMQILTEFFLNNPAINAKREEALAAGVPFVFSMPEDVRQQLDKADRMLNC